MFFIFKRKERPVKLAMTLLVRDEADIIKENIDFHLNLGVDSLVITDNGSQDGTRDILEAYRKDGVVKIIDEPGRNLIQTKWVDRMIGVARDEFNANWILNNDADEFWFVKSGNIKNTIKYGNFNVLKCERYQMPILQSTLDSGSKFYNNNLLLSKPKEMRKVIHSVDGYKLIHMGNHDVDMDNRVVKKARTSLTIYHYPIRSYEQFKRKVVNGTEAVLRNTECAQSAAIHWKRWYDLYRKGLLEEEFKTFVFDEAKVKDSLKRRVAKIDNSVKNCFE